MDHWMQFQGTVDDVFDRMLDFFLILFKQGPKNKNKGSPEDNNHDQATTEDTKIKGPKNISPQ